MPSLTTTKDPLDHLIARMGQLHASPTVAQKLLEVETLTREEFEAIFPPPVIKKSGTPQVIGMGA